MNKNKIDKILFGIGVDSFNRFNSFLKIKNQLKGKDYWYALRRSYESSDNLYKFSKKIKECFLKDEPYKEHLMEPDEIKFLNSLPSQITIYRGMTEIELHEESFGCSWSLKEETAYFFAHTYLRNFDTRHLNKIVHEITIDKKDVIAFFNSREEYEIIYISNNRSKQ